LLKNFSLFICFLKQQKSIINGYKNLSN